MVQTLYSLIAIALVMILSLNLLRTTTGTEQRMVLNEVATQVTGVAVNLMEHIGNQAFDENTHEGKAIPQPPVFPLVTTTTQLTAAASFGGCATFYDPACDDVDDFDGMTLTKDVEGIPYTAVIAVQYVSETDPETASGTQTFAKEVIITVSSPFLRLGDNPIQASLSRVFAYKRITT